MASLRWRSHPQKFASVGSALCQLCWLLVLSKNSNHQVFGFSTAPPSNVLRSTLSARTLRWNKHQLQQQQQRSSSSSLRGVCEAYEFCLTHYQLPTESLTAACCAGLGDWAAQQRAKKTAASSSSSSSSSGGGAIDWTRVAVFMTKGAVAGVCWSRWYAWLDPFVTDLASQWRGGDDVVSSLVKDVVEPAIITDTVVFFQPSMIIDPVLSTAMEQILFCPVLFSLWDLPFPMLCRGDPVHIIPSSVRSMLVPVLVENSKIWTFANLLIYSAPLQYRVVLTSLADAVWQMMLAEQLATAQPVASEPPAELLVPLLATSASFEQDPSSVLAMEPTGAVEAYALLASVE